MNDSGQKQLDQAFDALERETPEKVARFIHKLRSPSARWVRLPVGFLLIIAGFFGFLPVLGVEMIPIGLLLVAQDIPFLRRPVAHAALWLLVRWLRLRHWWQRRHKKQPLP